MKYKLHINVALTILIIVVIAIISLYAKHVAESRCIKINIQDNKIIAELPDGSTIESFERSSVTYLYIPRYIDITRIDQSESDVKILTLDNKVITHIKYDVILGVNIATLDSGVVPWRVAFLHLDELPIVDIRLDGYSADEIHHDNFSEANMRVINSDGTINYKGEVDIKGHGNSTWDEPIKKPYTLKLPQKKSILSMKKVKSYTLLASVTDITKMRNIVGYELAKQIGVKTVNIVPVCVYLNGDYQGLYQLCEKISPSSIDIEGLSSENKTFMSESTENIMVDGVKGFDYDTGNMDISGGYIIEIANTDKMQTKDAGFSTDKNTYISRSPDNASIEEMKYIRDIVNNVDYTIDNDIENIYKCIGIESFINYYLAEEFIMNDDFPGGSTYFYKKAHDNRLYAGPIWDLDHSAAKLNSGYDVIVEPLASRIPEDNWFYKLYNYKPYKDELTNRFRECQPYIEHMLTDTLDEYYELLEYSIKLEEIRFGGYDHYFSKYRDPLSEYKLLKRALTEHYINMCKCYDTQTNLTVEDSDEEHKVEFVDDNGNCISVIYVKDGTILMPSDVVESPYGKGWELKYGYAHLGNYIPIYEDTIFCPSGNTF